MKRFSGFDSLVGAKQLAAGKFVLITQAFQNTLSGMVLLLRPLTVNDDPLTVSRNNSQAARLSKRAA